MAPMTIVRSGLGAVYLVAPEWIPVLLGVRLDRRARLVLRVLGARHLIQAGVVSSAPARGRALAVGCGVDAIHAASMVLLAAVDRRRRRLAVADAGVAGAFAATGWRAAHRSAESGAGPA
jgi:hypothetical protein